MKRLVCIGLTLAIIMTGLFCFTVNAATNVEGDIDFSTSYGYTLDYPFDSSGSTEPYVNRTYTVTFTISNLTNEWVIPNDESFGVRLSFGSGGTNYQMMVNNEINCTVERSNNSSSMSDIKFTVRPLNGMILAPREVYVCSFDYDMTVWGTYTPGFTVESYVNLPHTSTYTVQELLDNDNLPANALAYADANRVLLQQIADSMESLVGTSDLTNDANSAASMADQTHSAEASMYQANSQALANSGISNPNFEAADRTPIATGFGNVHDIFSDLWSSIGPLRNIYVYVLMIGLATFMIRHRSWISVRSSRSALRDYNGGDHQ